MIYNVYKGMKLPARRFLPVAPPLVAPPPISWNNQSPMFRSFNPGISWWQSSDKDVFLSPLQLMGVPTCGCCQGSLLCQLFGCLLKGSFCHSYILQKVLLTAPCSLGQPASHPALSRPLWSPHRQPGSPALLVSLAQSERCLNWETELPV